MRFMLISIEGGHAVNTGERCVVASAQVIVEPLARDYVATALALERDHTTRLGDGA